MQAAGSLRGTLTKPLMNLPFSVRIARGTQSSGSGLEPTTVWTFIGAQYRCDALPIKDELYFEQTGTQNVATAVFHFIAGTDIHVTDHILMLSPDCVVGDQGGWFEVTEKMSPSTGGMNNTDIGYIRCYVRATSAPKGL